MYRILIFTALLYCTSIVAQVPGYEIYLMYIDGNEDSGYVYSEPENITKHFGYDNQPSFSLESDAILFASFRDSVQSDIYKYSIINKTTKQLTNTAESEYSPEMTADNKYFTVVRVEKDEKQRLWKFKKDGTKPKVLLQYILDVGYYCRINKNTVALFQLPEPFTLKLANIINQNSKAIDDNIGRCIKLIPGENAISYISKDDSTKWQLCKYDFVNGFSVITDLSPMAEDFMWYKDENLFMAVGNVIWYFDYQNDNKWYVFADMSKFDIGHIYRISVSPDYHWIAFVAEETIPKK